MSSLSEREKAKDKALRKLTPTLVRKLDAKAVRNDLYGKGQLTWRESSRIEAAGTDAQAAEELLKALQRRGPDVLDVLLECLKEEDEGEGVVNSFVIGKIREVWPEVPKHEANSQPTQPPDPSPAILKEFQGHGEWSFPVASQASLSSAAHLPPPPPPEGVDNIPKLVYKMNARPRGVGIVINNRNFTCGMKDRVGTDKDADSLVRLFKYLGFYTNRYDNLNGSQMHQKMKDVSKLDHSDFDCLVVAILTHGVSGQLYSTDGILINVDDFTKNFDGNHCPSLIGKPKVFILQACRGGRFDYGVEMDATDSPSPAPTLQEDSIKELMEHQMDRIVEKALDDDETDGGGYSQALPTEADFLLAYATVPGYVSWRNSEYGSWFVKAFVDTMFELTKSEHLMDILTEVNRRVAEEFQSKGRNKQVPAPVTMLTRKLYFRPGQYS